MASEIQASRFWSAFRNEADTLRSRAFSGHAREVYLEVKQMLHEHGIQLPVELTAEDENVILIFPPESSFSQARVIDQFLNFAVEAPGWKFLGRRQQKQWTTAFAHLEASWGVDARDARFATERIEEGISVTVFSSVHDLIDPVSKDFFVFHLLSHALGDEMVLSRICVAILSPPKQGTAETLSPDEFCTLIRSCPPLIDW